MSAIESVQKSAPSEPVRSYSRLQAHFMERLTRLLRLRRYYQDLAGDNQWMIQLLDRTIFSTLCDCIDLEVGEEARRLLKEESPG